MHQSKGSQRVFYIVSKIVKLSREPQEDYKEFSAQGGEWMKKIHTSCEYYSFQNLDTSVTNCMVWVGKVAV